MLVLSILLICAFIISTYRVSFLKAIEKKRIDKATYIPFALLFAVIVPVVVMNTFYSQRYFESPQEKMEFAERYKDESLYHEGFEEYADQNKMNASIQIEFLRFYFFNYLESHSCAIAKKRYKKEDFHASRIARLYINMRCNPSNIDEEEIEKINETLPGANFILAFYHELNGQNQKAINYYEREIKNNPGFKTAYIYMAHLLRSEDIKKFDAFMNQQAGLDHLSYYEKNDYFFNQGQWGAYFTNIFLNRTLNTSWLVIFIAFVVSFIWLYYLRLMDVYNREKWLNVLLVFFLGGLFTNFCLPIYDFARLNLDFHISGEAWNDFWYCVIIIGGGEELVKFLPWLIFGLLSRRLKEPFDFIIYASASALGFAFVENFMYLENYANITSRAIITSVAHMFDAVIVAYAFIVVKYRMKNAPLVKKAIVVLTGFLLAMLAHGFYDFWLISSAVEGLEILTLIFFFLTLHVWFIFKKNAMNHSPFFKGNEKFNIQLQKNTLYVAIIGVLMLEYVVLGLDYGTNNTERLFFKEMGYAGFFLFYMSGQLNNFQLARGVWHKFTLKKMIPAQRIKKLFNRFSEYGYQGTTYSSESKSEDLTGLKLRLFAPKSNKYIGNQLPVTGVCLRSISVNHQENWYLFALNAPVSCSTYLSNKIIIKSKNEHKSLLDDKIEIYFMFIPHEELLLKSNVSIAELRYADRAYSRPLNPGDFFYS